MISYEVITGARMVAKRVVLYLKREFQAETMAH